MADVDNMVLRDDPDATTMLACYLNAAMARSSAARDAYARIYSQAWAPLGLGLEINDGASASAHTRR